MLSNSSSCSGSSKMQRRWTSTIVTMIWITSIEQTCAFAQPLKLDSMLEGLTKGVSSLAYNPDGKSLASGWRIGKVILWDLDTKTQKWTTDTTEAAHTVPVAFRPDGQQLAWGDY